MIKAQHLPEKPIKPVIEMVPGSYPPRRNLPPAHGVSPGCRFFSDEWDDRGMAQQAIPSPPIPSLTPLSLGPECHPRKVQRNGIIHSRLSVFRNNWDSRTAWPYLKHLARGDMKKIRCRGKRMEYNHCSCWKTVLLPSGISQWGPRPSSLGFLLVFLQ